MRIRDADFPPLYRALAPLEARRARAGDTHGLREAVSLDGWGPLWTGLARGTGLVPPAGEPDADPGAVPRGRGDAPWRRRADGSPFGPARERGTAAGPREGGPRFDAAVPPGGYAWWYVDAVSDDGRYGLTIIAFIGSVFSPYYVASGKGLPEDHVALNVALYGPGARRWAMTERGSQDLHRSRDSLSIGPSHVSWENDCLSFDIEEVGAVFGERVRGRVRVHPEALVASSFQLDPKGRHRWEPVATRARIEVAFDRPGLSWDGDAYVDSNFGSEPMENRFRQWQWSRAHVPGGTAVFYEGERLDGSRFALALNIDRAGIPHLAPAPSLVPLRPTGWLMPRATRSEQGARVLKTWEDAPFYARSALATTLGGREVLAVHESLSLSRFISPVVQWMLPYRMPRKAGL